MAMASFPGFGPGDDVTVCQRFRGLDERSTEGLALDTIHTSDSHGAQLMSNVSSATGMVARLVRGWRSWVAVGIAAGVLAGCASVSHPPAPPMVANDEYSYIIGAGDNLNIQVWRNPELSMSVPVRPDGKIAAPLVDEMVVQGKTSVEVAREVEKQLGKYVRDPIVTVIVTSFIGPYSEQIRVVGEAAKPQFLPYKQKMTVLDVMIAVGGLTDFASGNSATILRTAEGNKQYSVRLKDLIKRGDVSANVEMRPGDILIIPQSLF
jgi:polysaccharide export outer membrane protein